MGHIYCLFSTRPDGNPRYVGKCRGRLGEPFGRHTSDARYGPYTQVGEWIRSEWLDGYDVEIHELESDVPFNLLHRRESDWMRQFPNLVNERKRSKIGKTLTLLGRVHWQMCRNSIDHIVDNYNGRHGVRRKEIRLKECNETDDSGTIEVVSVDFYASVSCIMRNVNGECYCCDRFGVAVRCGDLAKALEWRDELRKQLERRELEGNSAILSPRPWPPDRPQAAAISDQSASGSYTLSA